MYTEAQEHLELLTADRRRALQQVEDLKALIEEQGATIRTQAARIRQLEAELAQRRAA